MNKSQTIKMDVTGGTATNKYFQIRLEQDVDTLEFMSIKLDTKDAYNTFNSDYGVIVGRVTANGGVGIQNAKISIFIPLDEEDEENGEIVSIYPYKEPTNKNKEGKRYNLLPRVSSIDPETKLKKPKQAFGSFNTKEEWVTNPTHLEVYKKYYKYTTVTNGAGDYMLFGVPVGTQKVHMSCDITDIGKYSMNPAAMVTNMGYSPNLFTRNGSRIKPSDDLDDLPHIETQEVSVDVLPFWGDSENFIIGITRLDFRVRAQLTNTFTIFGSVYTDGDDSMWGCDYVKNPSNIKELYRMRQNNGEYGNGKNIDENVGIASKRIGKVTENIYYYPAKIPDNEISSADPRTDMVKLDKSEYSIYKRDGDFVFIINCNRRKVITTETGGEKVVSDDNPNGVFTEFKGFITLELTENEVPMEFSGHLDERDNFADTPELKVVPIRYRLKFPQSTVRANSFREEKTTDAENDTQSWRKDHRTFLGGNIYSVARFHGTSFYAEGDGNDGKTESTNNGFLNHETLNNMNKEITVNGDSTKPWLFNSVGMTQTNNYSSQLDNEKEQMPSNAITDSNRRQVFGANWMNFSVHFPQIAYLVEDRSFLDGMRSSANFSQDFRTDYMYRSNTQEIAAGDINTQWFARNDLHYTDFILVPPSDIVTILEKLGNKKGFKSSELGTTTLDGLYKNGESSCPENGGHVNADPDNAVDTEIYFYRGFDTADCLQYLVELGIVD